MEAQIWSCNTAERPSGQTLLGAKEKNKKKIIVTMVTMVTMVTITMVTMVTMQETADF